jgi:hypothetical protein
MNWSDEASSVVEGLSHPPVNGFPYSENVPSKRGGASKCRLQIRLVHARVWSKPILYFTKQYRDVQAMHRPKQCNRRLCCC